MKHRLVDLVLELITQTNKAYLFSDTGEEKNAKWLPKSQCEAVQLKGNTYEVTLEEWLAKERGWI